MAKRPRSPKPIDVSAIEGVREAPFPGFVPLCHPTLRTKLPEGGDWLYEAKLDGYRVQLHRHDGQRSPTPAMASTGTPNSRRCAPRSPECRRAASYSTAKSYSSAPERLVY